MSHSLQFSRSALLPWTAAAAVAAFPTWEEWRSRLRPEWLETRACLGGFGPWETSPLDPLRGDLARILENVVAWGVPALLVLAGFAACMGRREPRRAGRRTSGVLVLIALIEPATPVYVSASAEDCGSRPERIAS
ncbi:hypothetical protein HNP84_003492 [Thermocatellispora tengchongensis]|uniref:Uncharacterized protein n=1 Tax=Thermocatellispora tengchongensis TaxID=1073253 RepID=A0A840P5E5_9ACTN|nr:hypothetical protein [Thermocatellispora tengchongensis]MBB5133766.1 hypothetical protein [Thermocatellispora tengchongensis]